MYYIIVVVIFYLTRPGADPGFLIGVGEAWTFGVTKKSKNFPSAPFVEIRREGGVHSGFLRGKNKKYVIAKNLNSGSF